MTRITRRRRLLLIVVLVLLAGFTFLKLRVTLMDRTAYHLGFDDGVRERTVDKTIARIETFHQNSFTDKRTRTFYNLGFEDGFVGRDPRYPDTIDKDAIGSATSGPPRDDTGASRQAAPHSPSAAPNDYAIDSLYGVSPPEADVRKGDN